MRARRNLLSEAGSGAANNDLSLVTGIVSSHRDDSPRRLW
jgi:hypothetical protein